MDRTPSLAIQNAWKVVHFALDIFDRNPPRDLGPLAPYEVPKGADVVEDQYFVMLKESASLDAHFDWIGLQLRGPKYRFRWIGAFNGYRAHLSDLPKDTVENLIRYDPHVDRIDPNVYVRPGFGGRRTVRNRRSNAKWHAGFDVFMKWWNKMILAGKRVDNWTLQPGVFDLKVAESRSD
ncbi:MAG: hypothetical protein Q9160_008242 [Pyrenula sp. 1 TL-2023]